MSKKQSYLGIDMGGSSLKLVELKNTNGRSQLVTYGYLDEIPNLVKDESAAAQKEIGVLLKHLLKRSKTTSITAISALPSYSVFSSIITLPAMSKKDLISAVRWEAKKFVPIPLEEMILDWEVLTDSVAPGKAADSKPAEGAKPNTKILLTAAPKNLVNRFVGALKEAELQVVGLETESFALARVLVGNDRNPVMAIDIGGNYTNIIIYSEGVPMLNRSIDVGGHTVTKSVARTTGLDAGQAEQFKRDLDAQLIKSPSEALPEPVSYLLNSIVNEIKYILNIYRSQHKNDISRIILTGGSSTLMDFPAYLQNLFNIKSFIADPWARVIHPVEIDSLLKQIGPRLAVSVGLAMREIV